MRIYRLAMLSGPALAIMAGAAFAQDNARPQTAPEAAQFGQDRGGPPMKRRLARLDQNKDGTISLEEFTDRGQLQEADTNKDGVLSVDELATMIEKRRTERMAERLTRRLDVDGDGKVTLAELNNRAEKRFALLDSNNDGKLEANELRGKHDGKKFRHSGFRQNWR